MKRVTTIILLSVLFSSVPASASNRYSSFGNFSYEDCTFVAVANLVRYHSAKAQITTTEVVEAWQENDAGGTNDFGGLNYLVSTGFGGITASSYYGITSKSAFIAAANSTGIYSFETYEGAGHAVSVIHATSKTVTYFSLGSLNTVPWKAWNKTVLSSYGIVWN